MSLNIKFDGTALDLFPGVTERGFKKAVRRALRDTARTMARRIAATAGAQDSAALRRALKKGMNTYLAPAGNWGYVNVRLQKVSAARLGPKPTARGVRYNRRVERGAFIARARGAELVFKRRGRDRLPLDKMAVDRRQETVQAVERVRAAAAALLQKNLERQLERALYVG